MPPARAADVFGRRRLSRPPIGNRREPSQHSKGVHLDAKAEKALRQAIAAHPTISAAARAVRVNRTTARRMHKLMLEEAARASTPASKGMGGTPQDRKIVELTDEVSRLRRELLSAHRDSLDEEAVKTLLGRLGTAAEVPPDWLIETRKAGSKDRTPEVPVAIWSDWHVGEVVSRAETSGVNEFDLAIAERRIRALVEATINLCRHHGPGQYPGMVINLLGDFISGALHPELLRTDEEEVIPAALRVRDLLVWALERMLAEFKRLYVPCTSGNHGRQTPKPELKRYVYKNFDWLIYQLLARHFEGRKDIVFDIPSSNEAHYRVFGLRFLAVHGDMLGVKGGDGIIGSIGPIMRGEIKTRGRSTSSGRDYDVLLMGHWHQQLWLPRAIVANSLKGFDEYAKNALSAPPSEPSQPLFFIHPRRGITSRWEVKVETPGTSGEAAWVSWPGQPAGSRQERTAA